jgi:hypothetical protein
MKAIKSKSKGRKHMPSIVVLPTEKGGKFKVLVNYIQRGVDYSSQEMANEQATKLRKEIEGRHIS